MELVEQPVEHRERHDNLQHVSSLMDGELAREELPRAIGRIKVDDAAGREAWDTYHLIGDVLRDGAAGAPAVSAGFSARFSERLAAEPVVIAPASARALAAANASTATRGRIQTYALSAAASVAAVAVVGWMALSNISGNKPAGAELAKLEKAPAAAQPQVAAVTPQTAAALVAAAKPAPGTEPEHVHEYLLAHQGISPTTAFQGVAPYVRTVSAAGN